MTITQECWSHPKAYQEAAIIAQIAGAELLSRLEWMKLTPKLIVEIGCGTGELSQSLQQRFPTVELLSIDYSLPMLANAKKACSNIKGVAADGMRLPLRDRSIDLIMANFFLPWQRDVIQCLREWRRVLRAEGIILFTMLGLDTMQEWKTMVSPDARPQFVDMHDIGDLLLAEGFEEPVLDVNHYTTSYRDKLKLVRELQASGMWFANENDITQISPLANEPLEVTYEVIYAHAFKVEKNLSDADGVTHVSLVDLRNQLKKSK